MHSVAICASMKNPEMVALGRSCRCLLSACVQEGGGIRAQVSNILQREDFLRPHIVPNFVLAVGNAARAGPGSDAHPWVLKGSGATESQACVHT